MLYFVLHSLSFTILMRRRGGLVVERRAPEREVGGSILTRVTVLYL